jgi:hypothetical protein
VTFRQSHVGRYEDRAEFLFDDIQLQKKFLISRTLRAIIGSKADHQLLRPSAPYVRRERVARQPEVTVVEGVKPASLKAIPYAFKLPIATIPKPLLSTLSSTRSSSEGVTRIKNVFLPSSLNSDTYARHFKHLLWIEEYQMECASFTSPNLWLLMNSLVSTWSVTIRAIGLCQDMSNIISKWTFRLLRRIFKPDLKSRSSWACRKAS